MATIYYPAKTMQLIEDSIAVDQGAKYRGFLGKVLPHIGDAYREEEDGFRSHLGGSLLGRKCARELWYGFRWAVKKKVDGRLSRLFNRGHLEEGRFIAILLTCGFQVYQQDANGKQFRIDHAHGHVGGSLDAVIVGLPDVAEGMPVLGEFKTHNDKSFQKLKKEGVELAKPEHFIQMQLYMRKMGLGVAFYLAVNKNDDELYGELIPLNSEFADRYFDRGEQIVFLENAPPKVSETPGWFECRFCDMKGICHGKDKPEVNCRTCVYAKPVANAEWRCMQDNIPTPIPKDLQLKGCSMWTKHPDL